MTHEERAERRKRIAAFAVEHSVSAAAAEFKVSPKTVYTSVWENFPEQRQYIGQSFRRMLGGGRPLRTTELRAEIAHYAQREGLTAAAREYTLSTATVRAYCNELGIRAATNANLPPKPTLVKLRALHMLLYTDMSSDEIGGKLCITRQAVDFIRLEAIEVGFKLGDKRKGQRMS